jgi:hypothetical protein
MNNYTYKFCESVSNALNVIFVPTISDQELDEIISTSDHQNVPSPQSAEIRQAISEACKGRVPWNKGKTDPSAREHMKLNNPMFDPECILKMANSKRGVQAHNKITTTFKWSCKHCNKSHVDYDTIKKRKAANFCGKSCAASYSNARRYRCD